jgi:hypothetical protein
VLSAKLELPAYLAVIVRAPVPPGVYEQLPAATLALQLPPSGSVTVTVPVGVPPGEVTVKLTVTIAPASDGSGESPVIVVVVAAAGTGFTRWFSPSELPAKRVSPEYVAVSLRLVPGAANVISHLPCATEAEQDSLPPSAVTVT